MVKYMLIFFSLFALDIQAQEEGGAYIHKGLFCSRGTISFGKMTKLDANTIFLSGNIEYFVDDNISLRGDGYFFMGTFNSDEPFLMHHSLFSGMAYHFKTKSHFDPYCGLEMGINLAQATSPCLGQHCALSIMPTGPEPSKTFSPVVSPILGFNFFGNKWFHINLEARYILGKFADNYNSVSLGEFRFSFGLGFNIF